MQNHNVKIKNSAYRPIRLESVEDPGTPGCDLKKQSQSPAFGVNSFTGGRYENKSKQALSPFDYPFGCAQGYG
jgi:hypothetical protein